MAERKLTAEEIAALGLEAPARKLGPEEISNLNLEAVPTEETTADKFRAFLRKGSQLASDVQGAPLRLALSPGAELAPEAPTGAALRKFGHGAAYGFTDELRGAGGAVDELNSRAMPFLPFQSPQYPDAPLSEALRKRYELERDTARREGDTAQREQPAISTISEIGGAIAAPNPFAKLAAAGRVGRLAAAAGQGELYGLGSSRASDAGGIMHDTTEGGGVGLLAGTAAEPVGALAKWFRGLKAKGQASELANVTSKTSDLVDSRSGSMGGETSSAMKQFEHIEAMAKDPIADPADRNWAINYMASPEFAALKSQVYSAVHDRAANIGPRLTHADALLEDAQRSATPQAIESTTKANLDKSTLLNDVLPRVGRYADRAVPAAVGGAIGGPAGSLAGSAAGAAMGAPSTSFGNLLNASKTPRFSYRVGQYGSALTAGPAALATKAAPATLATLNAVGSSEAGAEAARQLGLPEGDDPESKAERSKRYFLSD